MTLKKELLLKTEIKNPSIGLNHIRSYCLFVSNETVVEYRFLREDDPKKEIIIQKDKKNTSVICTTNIKETQIIENYCARFHVDSVEQFIEFVEQEGFKLQEALHKEVIRYTYLDFEICIEKIELTQQMQIIIRTKGNYDEQQIKELCEKMNLQFPFQTERELKFKR